ncbi:single-stranded DNA-binding protein [Brucella pseudogrignonensis]|uniref:Single-stranded DNA-binding protein n=1 Tax=Brucella pseudogrignonensis TaxID=419475 RepID=A0ABU1M5C4_9HYPH|nr:single-stranded DNA-binding protein [Brucella pseudogrignonensis]MDR6431248.1 single-strand DNA-binding protein [Brucella pseudogrignonensis]
MAGINKTILVGRVGQDPEVRRFNSGDQVAEFSLATSKEWRDKNTGERKSKTTWHKIKVLNNSLIENVIRPYVNKGALIGIEGELDNEEWEKDGQKRQATKVVVGAFGGSLYLLGNKDDNGGGDRGSRSRDDDRGSRSSGRNSGTDRNQSSSGYGGGFSGDIDDEIPF